MKKQTSNEFDRLLAALSYVWVFFTIPYALGYHKPFVHSHARQGLVLFVFEIILLAVGWVPVIGWFVALAGWIFVVTCSVVGIAHALSGKYWRTPLLDQYVHHKH